MPSYSQKMKLRKLEGTNMFTGEGNIRTGSAQCVEDKNGKYVQARPIGYIGILYRIKCSLLVLVGMADVVVWEKD